MADPFCRECAQLTGGCWRHNGTGIYMVNPDGTLRQTHAPVRKRTACGYIEYLAPIDPADSTTFGSGPPEYMASLKPGEAAIFLDLMAPTVKLG